MARPRSSKVSEVKARLVARVGDGLHRPGDRFMSNRAIAEQFGVSYQTADRLVRELCAEGLLVRRSASGTYLAGAPAPPSGVVLLFHERGRRRGSFGARLLAEVTARLDRDRVPWRVRWVRPDAPLTARAIPAGAYPVIWEVPVALAACVAGRRSALLLNDRPPSGLASVFIDSISTDDVSGGASAAELLVRRTGRRAGFAVFAGPVGDRRSDERVAGFRSIADATVVPAGGWYFDEGRRSASRVMALAPAGVFCCNDRLAEALVAEYARRGVAPPPLVGFDDAPVAEALNLTTVAIPWSEIATAAAAVVRQRLSDNVGTARSQSFAPRPVVRML